MLDRLIAWLQKRLAEISAHRKRADGEVVAEAEAEGVVLRFQGRYDCGYPWPLNKIAPEFCPEHGEGCNRVYRRAEKVEFTNVRALRVKEEI